MNWERMSRTRGLEVQVEKHCSREPAGFGDFDCERLCCGLSISSTQRFIKDDGEGKNERIPGLFVQC